MSTRIARTTAILTVLPLLGAAMAPRPLRAVAAGDARLLPSVVKLWSQKLSAEKVIVRGSVVYVRSGARLSAIAARSGRLLWSRSLGEWSCCGDNLLLTAEMVAVGADDKLLLLRAADGSQLNEVALGGAVSAIAGPPIVVAVTPDEGSAQLVAVDAASGEVRNRLDLQRSGFFDLAVQDGVAVANLAGLDEGELPVTAGFAAATLKELWRSELRSLPVFERIGGRLHLQVLSADGEDATRFHPLDPATGKLGPALPERPPAPHDSDLTWEVQTLAASPAGTEPDSGPATARLRRLDPATGRPLWAVDLPGTVRAVARASDLLYAECDRGGGRGILATLAWSDGAVLQLAHGLPRSQIFEAGRDLPALRDLVIVADDGEVAAYSGTTTGPPELAADSLEEQVRRILLDRRGDDRPGARGEPIADRQRELETLGLAALPIATRLVADLGPTSLVAAAGTFAAAGHRAAAAPLARRLESPLEELEPGNGREEWNPQVAVLRALAAIGGDPEVQSIATVLASPGRRGTVRRQALATLAALRTPAADRAVRAFLARPLDPAPVWNPPSPQPFLDLAAGIPGAIPLAAETADASPDEARRRARAARALTAGLPGGNRLLLFCDSYLGSPEDLWAAELDRGGHLVGRSRFTGVQLPDTAAAGGARVVGNGTVEVRTAAGVEIVSFTLAQLDADSDGDGLSDLVEQRLRLDPHNQDSDGDGLPDAEDPAPNARLQAPLDNQQEIAAAIFRQFFQFEKGSDGDGALPREVAIMVSDFALEWRGRSDPTITLNEREAARFSEEVGARIIPQISIRRGEPLDAATADPVTGSVGEPALPSRRDEEVYTLTLDRGPLGARRHRVVIRDLDAGQRSGRHLWVICDLRPVGSR
ncbi:MAG TPA: PQQ-binding-like beta-propeller repeat protein [Thermoanaerobaculia bacterium]|nr:PQQ-binding-like beta-propeller repeat protein [Thermoanaerobaculia bacterium]